MTKRSRRGQGAKFRTLNGKTVPYHVWLWVQHNGPIPICDCEEGEAFHIHHKDHDHSNNVIENLVALHPSEHASHHAALREKCAGCKVDGCQSTSTKGFADGYCPAHYQQIRKHGEIISVSAKRLGSKKKWATCSVEGCGSAGYSLGYCIRHYDQMRTHGEIKYVEKVIGGTKKWTSCKVEGCVPTSMKGACQGYCDRHYQQIRKFGKIVSVDPITKTQAGTHGASKRWGTSNGAIVQE